MIINLNVKDWFILFSAPLTHFKEIKAFQQSGDSFLFLCLPLKTDQNDLYPGNWPIINQQLSSNYSAWRVYGFMMLHEFSIILEICECFFIFKCYSCKEKKICIKKI